MLNPTSVLQYRSDVRYRVVGDEGIVVRQDAAEVIAVNGVGASVLTLLDSPKSVAQVVEALLAQYDVEQDSLRRDVETFLEELRQAGVVEEVEKR